MGKCFLWVLRIIFVAIPQVAPWKNCQQGPVVASYFSITSMFVSLFLLGFTVQGIVGNVHVSKVEENARDSIARRTSVSLIPVALLFLKSL